MARLDPYRWAVWIAVAVVALVLFLVGQPNDIRQALALAAACGAFAAVVALLWRQTRLRMEQPATPRRRRTEVGLTVLCTAGAGVLALIGSFVVAQALLPDQVIFCGRPYAADLHSTTDIETWGPLRLVGRAHGLDLYAPQSAGEAGSCQGPSTTVLFTKDLGGRWHSWALQGGP